MRALLISGCIAIILAAVIAGGVYRHTTQYDFIIGQAAARNHLDFYLVKSLICEESWFRPWIKGASGELGLMQITKAAALDFATQKGFPPLPERNLLEPELNLEVGCWYLQHSWELYKNSPHPELFALLRYNAGESRADHWLQVALSSPPPPQISPEEYYLSVVDFPKTRAYASRIMQRARSRTFWRLL
jgi:soluble lytic murein transglycosylase